MHRFAAWSFAVAMLSLGGCAGEVASVGQAPGSRGPADPAVAAMAATAASWSSPVSDAASAEQGWRARVEYERARRLEVARSLESPTRDEPPLTPAAPPPVAKGPTAPAAPPAAAHAREETARLRRLAAERRSAGPRASYEIGAGDLLEINVFDVEEMNRTVRVSQSGYINLPLIGAVKAEGRSEAALSAEIARRLELDYVRNPQVDVFVAEYRSQQVAVTGAVAEPGLYPLTRKRHTILDVLSEAGGLTDKAGAVVEFIPASSSGRSAVYDVASAGGALPLRRGGTGAVEGDTITIDLNELLRGGNDTALNVPVAAGDVVFVPEAGDFTIEGWIDKPGTYKLTSKTTVLAALSAGGGPLLPAKLSNVKILRNARGGGTARDVLEVDLEAVREGRAADVPLRSGDIVRIPGRPLLMVPWGVYSLFANLVRIGASFPLL